MATITLYGINNCDTVKRARAWLAGQGATVSFHDFKKAGLPPAALDRWLATAGRERLVNRQGLMWRKLDEAQRARTATDAGARGLLLELPSLVKRPVVEWPDGVLTVGFDAEAWAARIAAIG
jgi:Spx/MgsR family transcriptional regulator